MDLDLLRNFIYSNCKAYNTNLGNICASALEKVQRISSINDRWKIDRGRVRIV